MLIANVQARQHRSTLESLVNAVERIRSQLVELLVGADPGLTQLRAAAQSVLTIAVALGAEWIFVHLTGALQIPSGATASVAAACARLSGPRR